MNIQVGKQNAYTIMEAAKLSGLPESTLRYYETRGVIRPIHRDVSSKHRVYSEDDIDYIVSIACLSATGMSIEDMLSYLANAGRGQDAAVKQIELLGTQGHKLADEERYLKLRQTYLQTKIAYWKAIANKDQSLANEIAKKATAIAKEVKLQRVNN